mgnify:CR=1 FL=1
MASEYKMKQYPVSSETDAVLLKNKTITNSFIMDLYDKIRKQRIYIMTLLFTLCFALCGIVLLSFKPKIVPYVVALNEREYEITKLGTQSNRNDVISDNTKKNMVQYFIKLLRTVSIDVTIVRNNIRELSYIVTEKGKAFVESMISKEQEYQNIGTLVRKIEVKTIINVGSDPNIYQIDWIEIYNEYSDNIYRELGSKNMRAIIKLEIGESSLENPLGIYVDKIDMGEIK